MFIDPILRVHILIAQKFEANLRILDAGVTARVIADLPVPPPPSFLASNTGYLLGARMDNFETTQETAGKLPYLIFLYRNPRNKTVGVAYKVTEDLVASECVLMGQHCKHLLMQRGVLPTCKAQAGQGPQRDEEMLGLRLYQYAEAIYDRIYYGGAITFLEFAAYRRLEFAYHVLQPN
jgi:hypothetical protein